MSDMFTIRNGLKRGDALSPLLFNFAIDYAIRSVQVNQNGLKFKGTHQLLLYADGVNVLKGIVHAIKCNTEYSLFASKESGIEVSAVKTKYTFLSRDQNAGRSHIMKLDNSSFETVERSKYLETTLTNQNFSR